VIAKNWDNMGSFLAISDGFSMRHRPSPSDEQNHRSDDSFRARLDQIIRSDHPLVQLPGSVFTIEGNRGFHCIESK